MPGSPTGVAQAPRGRSRPNRLARYTLILGAVWPIVLGLLWLMTGETVPLIDVRWVAGTTAEQRVATERELSLAWQEAKEPGTVRYFLLDAGKENLERIVMHPLVEDTAHVNRGTFVLENPSTARTWIGDRFTTPWPSAFLYVSLFGCAIGGVSLLLRD
jgi:hypothetical protein